MWLCDKCGSELVVSGKVKPLSEVYSGDIPWKNGECHKCGSQAHLMDYPILDPTHPVVIDASGMPVVQNATQSNN